jgi:hypothetical protein
LPIDTLGLNFFDRWKNYNVYFPQSGAIILLVIVLQQWQANKINIKFIMGEGEGLK